MQTPSKTHTAAVIFLLLISGASTAYQPPSAQQFYKHWVQDFIPIQRGLGPVPVETIRMPTTKEKEIAKGSLTDFDQYFNHENNQSAVVIKEGQLIYETYNNKWHGAKDFPVHGQSMTKAITGMTIGALVCSGKIASLNDPMGKYSATLKNSVYDNITVGQALQMRSGINRYNTDDGWKLWWMVTGDKEQGYAGKNHLRQHIRTVKNAQASSDQSEYHPNDSFALSILVQDLTGASIASSFSKEIFSKLNPAGDIYWMTDADGLTVPNSGLFLTARDWAKVGNFVQSSIYRKDCMGDFFNDGIKTAVISSRMQGWKFGYHFWTNGELIIFAGFGGQLIYINPENQTVVMASSVSPKYGDDYINGIAQGVVTKH